MKPDAQNYRPILPIFARDALMELARDLGFIVAQPGRHAGNPTPAALLERLADRYRDDPAAVALALRDLGIYLDFD